MYSQLAERTFAAPPWAAAPAVRKRPHRLFLCGVALALGVSSFVMVEPAPVDALVLGLAVIGFLSGILSLRGLHPLAIVPLAAFALANLVSMYNPPIPQRADFYLFVTLYLCLSWAMFVAIPSTYGAQGVKWMIRAYVVAAMICVIPVLLSYFHFIGFQKYLLLWGRPKGTFKDPNVYGPYLIPVAMFAIGGVIFDRKSKGRALLQAAIALLSSVGVFLSYSRASWINYSVSLVAFLFISYTFRPVGSKSPFPLSRAILVFAGVAICLGIVLQLPSVQEMLSARVSSSGLQGYDRDRFRTQREALETAIAHPLGIGPGQSEYEFLYSTHSSYMRVLCENGFFGLAAFLIFVSVCLGRALVMGWRANDPFWRKIFFIASACILGHIINSGVVDTIHWRHFWFLLALPWCAPPVQTSRPLIDAESTYYRDAAMYRVRKQVGTW